jgi:luciferase family oxidoreductase group 1
MLPNHAPLVVAEQFAMLEALHPGRIDLGLGRAPGTDPATAAALRRTTHLGADTFAHDLIELMGWLGDERVEEGTWSKFRATPAATGRPTIMLLGSSDYSARLAGQLGLGYAFAHHFDTPGTMEAIAIYRAAFSPSPDLAEPHTMVTAGVLAAETDEEAEYLSGPARLAVLGIRTNRRVPVLSPDAAAAHPDIDVARSMPSNRIVGSAETVRDKLAQLIERTAADEIMISTMTHGLPERIRTLELVAQHWPAA